MTKDKDKTEFAIRRIVASRKPLFDGISERQIEILCDIATTEGEYNKTNSDIARMCRYLTFHKGVKQALNGLERRGLINRIYISDEKGYVKRIIKLAKGFAYAVEMKAKEDEDGTRKENLVNGI